ncbi:MAG: cytochrome bc complex cytochrome b subunit [Nitrospirota bacterium]
MFRQKEINDIAKKTEKKVNLKGILNWLTLATGLFYGELDERLELRDSLKKVLKKPVPGHVNFWFCFGGITFLLFVINATSGVMLLMYYRPTIDHAYESVVHITNNAPFGWLIRGFHHWSANIMMITILIHMVRIYFYGAYKPPRDLNWVVGVILLCLTLTFGFTGYLLPWNQISYWATTVGTEIPGAVPVIGPMLKNLIRGGPDVGQITLTRFFALHVIILPWIMVGLLALHFLILRRLGISESL